MSFDDCECEHEGEGVERPHSGGLGVLVCMCGQVVQEVARPLAVAQEHHTRAQTCVAPKSPTDSMSPKTQNACANKGRPGRLQ